jgi:hypothetical protein
LHNIRLRFSCPRIWQLAKSGGHFKENEVSKDIQLPSEQFEEIEAKVTIHHNDTVSVALACSEYPIAEDITGINILTSILARLEERLMRKLDEWSKGCEPSCIIPTFFDWIVVLWHIGRDSIGTFSGAPFEMSWTDGAGALVRVYADEKRGRQLIRTEKQESPDLTYKVITERILDGRE